MCVHNMEIMGIAENIQENNNFKVYEHTGNSLSPIYLYVPLVNQSTSLSVHIDSAIYYNSLDLLHIIGL